MEKNALIALNYTDTMRFVILPQAILIYLQTRNQRHAQMSSLFSDYMQELTRRANELVVTEYRPPEFIRY